MSLKASVPGTPFPWAPIHEIANPQKSLNDVLEDLELTGQPARTPGTLKETPRTHP